MKKIHPQTKIKCKLIKLIISDVDGVLTDGGIYYSEKGETLKKFNTRDGMAIELLRKNNIKTLLMTKENSKIVKKRATKIKVASCLIGIKKKEQELKKISRKFHIKPENIAYVGDDINDIEIMKLVGFSISPADGLTEVKKNADYICKSKGGEGVLREIMELILAVQKAND